MCNKIHESGTRKLKEEGIAWKIFGPEKTPCFCNSSTYRKYLVNKDGWIKWKETNCRRPSKEGFCGFLSKKEGRRALHILQRLYNEYANRTLEQIQFRKGLVSQREDNMISGHEFRIILFKEFRLIKQLK